MYAQTPLLLLFEDAAVRRGFAWRHKKPQAYTSRIIAYKDTASNVDETAETTKNKHGCGDAAQTSALQEDQI